MRKLTAEFAEMLNNEGQQLRVLENCGKKTLIDCTAIVYRRIDERLLQTLQVETSA